MRFLLPLVLLSLATPALAAPVRQYDALALSPDGTRVAAVERGDGRGVITVRSAKDGKVLATLDPCRTCSYSGLTFAPDGSLAWLARDRAAGTVTLAVGKRTIATVAGIAQTPRFSPDGKRIALLVTIGAAKEAGANQAGVRQVGEIGEHNDEQRLAVFDIGRAPVAAASLRPLSPAGRYVYEYDWTPDGKGFVATTAPGNGDANWWVATLDAIDAQTGAVRTIAKPATQANFPRVSPDGRTVAYIGGLMSDFGSVGGDVWEVPFEGGTPVNRTAHADITTTSLAVTRGGFMVTGLAGDHAAIAPFGAAAAGPPFMAAASFSAGDARAAYSADGRTVATVVQDYAKAPAIYAGPVAAPVQITHDNDAVPALATARSIEWKSDGFDVQGWLLAPVGADPKKKAPMITIVHGGPAAAHVPGYVAPGSSSADLLAAGYYIFLPNPRGSYGQGEAFTAANRRDFGGGDLRDILAGIDAVEKVAPIDDARLGLTGASYGGFMAMWANTQTQRFKAIVAGAGISNWISYYGTNGIDQWMLPYFGKTLYDDEAAYRAPSAIYFMKQARTPTFIWVGERDIEVPPTQSIEYWHALKDLGVPASLVIYPDEGHGVRGQGNAEDLRARTVAWFDRYLKP
ncbi:S9 family peptidase [Sphingomonas immobilis]|uniref:S9 family peptidase n=1 Tax=Sphingomonas immobilis TaxID=3063997 RepID=A0ABT9A2M6_9SPHN|nr:S9 family peptidase [Sphingomonas sp. CA1-15]MDO7844089.1 S9 family peptidase [Sphingomonas sp. CA1-15]